MTTLLHRISPGPDMLGHTVILIALAALASSNRATPVYDTIIVGMGAAGTAAASVLGEAGKKVLALEAMDRVGGRVKTVPFGNSIVEVGAEWIHGERPSPVYDLAMRHNVSIRSQDLSKLEVVRSDGSNTNKDVFKELLNYYGQIIATTPKEPESMGQYVTRRITEYITEKHPELLNDKEFLAQLLHSLEMMVNAYEGSYNWNDVTTGGTYEDLEGDHQLSWHEHGYRTLFEILLNTYNGGPGYPTLNIKLEKVVTKISYPQDPAQDVEVHCSDGSVYKARNVIVTVSLGVLKESYKTLFSPELPASKTSAIENISMGLIGKIILLFPNKWSGDQTEQFLFLWTDEDVRAVGKDWANFIGTSIPMGNRNAMTVWTYGDTEKMIETLPDDVVKSKVMELVRRFMGKVGTIPDPIDMVRTTWYTNPYTRGTYTYENIQTPLHPNDRAHLAEPLVDSSGAPRVLFAGEATNTLHFSTVHGAVESGFREGRRLVPKAE